MRTRNRTQQAMSLIEVLVALGLTAVLTTLGYQLLMTAQRWSLQHQQRAGAVRHGWVTAHRFSKELRMAMSPDSGALWRGIDGNGGTLADVYTDLPAAEETGHALKGIAIHEDAISFPVALTQIPRQGDGPAVVAYRIKRDDKDAVLGLARRVVPLGGDVEDAEESVIDPDVVSLDVSYQDADGAWQPDWTDADAVPWAVHVTVGSVNRNDRSGFMVHTFSTTVAIPTGTRMTP